MDTFACWALYNFSNLRIRRGIVTFISYSLLIGWMHWRYTAASKNPASQECELIDRTVESNVET